jgi:DNA-binding transcriptional LysR family regulator
MIPAIDLNLALVLHTVIAERSVARAAAKLHVTPSAISNGLARLRELLGDPVVTRKGRGVVPTPRAAELAPGLARAMAEIEQVFLSAPFAAATCSRTFTLAVADLGQITWLPTLVETMRRELPLARLRVLGIDALLSMGDLGSSEVDVQVGLAANLPGVHVEPLYEETSVLVARKGHPLSARKLSRHALADLRYVRVDMAPGTNLRDPTAAHFKRLGVARVVTLTVPSFMTAAEVVARSELVTMMPRSLVTAKGKALGLCVLDAPMPLQRIPISMSWHERTHTDLPARAFRKLVRETVTSLPGKPAAARRR